MAWIRFRKRDMPGGLWSKCPSCDAMLYQKELLAQCNVCNKCNHHLPASVAERVQFTLDEDSFQEVDAEMQAVDALEFVDKTSYSEKLERNYEKTGRREAMVIGTGRVQGREIVFGALEFAFLGGSMGVVVGEKVTRAAELALERKLPLVLFAASGGARMHEGALSLMQMAKTCAALAKLNEAGGLFVSVLTHPTTGGVTASWATMADLILAEPGALIGFAGPRVIQNTIKQELPEGFQRSEFLLERGQIDRIVSREKLRDELTQLFDFLLGPLAELVPPVEAAEAAGRAKVPAEKSEASEEDTSDGKRASRNGAPAKRTRRKGDKAKSAAASSRSGGSSDS